MAQDLLNYEQLLAAFPDNDTQQITAKAFRDFVESALGVGGGETEDPTSGANPKGVEKLGNRRFRVLPGGEGTYLCLAQGNGDIDVQANVRVAVALNDVTDSPNYILNQTFIPGENNSIVLFEVHNCLANDELSLEFNVQGAGNVTVGSYFFTVLRIG